MATNVQAFPTPIASYQTVPLQDYRVEHQDLANRLFQRVQAIIGSSQAHPHLGSYSFFASRSSATVAKIIIYEANKGKTNGNWPDIGDGVYALIRANDAIGDRIWNELLPSRLPRHLQHATRNQTIGIAPNHYEQFVYVFVDDDNFEATARYLALCALA